jgi:hypothetical protein
MNTLHALVVFLMMTSSALLNAQSATKPVGSAAPGITTQVPPTNQASRPTDIEILLKYHEFLRKDSDATAARLNELVQTRKRRDLFGWFLRRRHRYALRHYWHSNIQAGR